jgi:SAM-dependent methyltransferase
MFSSSNKKPSDPSGAPMVTESLTETYGRCIETFSYRGSELEAMAQARNYYRWILRIAKPYLGRRVAEIGAGVGNFAAILIEEVPIQELFLIEPARNLHSQLEGRFGRDPRVRIVKDVLSDAFAFQGLQSLVAINTIEHIENDEEFLQLTYKALAPGGTVVLFAPALQAIFGSLDQSFDHFRRYNKRILIKLLQNAGFSLEKSLYLNFPGIISWFLAGKILRQQTLGMRQVRFYDTWAIPVIARIEHFCSPPLGQSILAIARKPVLTM